MPCARRGVAVAVRRNADVVGVVHSDSRLPTDSNRRSHTQITERRWVLLGGSARASGPSGPPRDLGSGPPRQTPRSHGWQRVVHGWKRVVHGWQRVVHGWQRVVHACPGPRAFSSGASTRWCPRHVPDTRLIGLQLLVGDNVQESLLCEDFFLAERAAWNAVRLLMLPADEPPVDACEMKLVAARELAQLVASCKGAEADCALVLPTGGLRGSRRPRTLGSGSVQACWKPTDSKLNRAEAIFLLFSGTGVIRRLLLLLLPPIIAVLLAKDEHDADSHNHCCWQRERQLPMLEVVRTTFIERHARSAICASCHRHHPVHDTFGDELARGARATDDHTRPQFWGVAQTRCTGKKTSCLFRYLCV